MLMLMLVLMLASLVRTGLYTEEIQSKMGNTMCMSCAKYLCLRGCAAPTLFVFLFFNFYFGVRDTSVVSIVSNSSIVTSVRSVSRVSIVCSGK